MELVSSLSIISIIFIMSWFTASKLFGPKISKTNSWISEFVRQFFTMPNFFWGTLFVVMGVGFALNRFFGPGFSYIERYYRYFIVVVFALLSSAISRQQQRAKKNRNKRRTA